MKEKLDNLLQHLKERAKIYENSGCSDHFCYVRPQRGGIGTNGGCKCLNGLGKLESMYIREKFQVLNAIILILLKAINDKELKETVNEIRKVL